MRMIDLPELVSANIISTDTAQQISDYYKRKQVIPPNRQLLIFAILGADYCPSDLFTRFFGSVTGIPF